MKELRRLRPYLRRHARGLLLGTGALLLTTAFSVASPWVLRHAVDDLQRQVTGDKLRLYAGLLLGLVLVEGLFRYAMRRVLIGLSREIEYELRSDLFAHLLRLPLSFYHRQRVGDVMNRAVSDLSAVRMVLGPGIMYTANTVATFVAACALMWRISPPLLGLALVPLVLVSVLVRHYGRQIHDRFEAVQAQLSEISALVQESLSGLRVVRAYVQEPHERTRFAAANLEHLERNRRLVRLYGALYPGIQLLMGLGTVLVVLVGGGQVVQGRITLGEFVAFSAYLAMLHWPMIAVGWVVNLFERGEASMGRLNQLLDAPPEIADGPLAPEAPLTGDLRVAGLTFSYPGTAAPTLRDVSFEVPAGACVAVVGPTGSGKSTLVQLLPRLYDPPPGTVFLGGHDVRELPLAALRGAIGMVPQEAFLFSARLRENLAFGLPQDDDPRALAAARRAQLAQDVADFPEQYETRVGERGLTLSGGQKQRVALARALAREPRLLILDDALSAVDTETEERVLQALRDVRGRATLLLVSHRVSTVKDADLILVLREGRVAERGTHEQLLELGGFYADLHRRQLLEQEMESPESAA